MPTLSPYTTAVASGSIRVVGALADANHLLVEGTVDRVEMRLFDYELRNGGPIKLALDKNVVRVQELQLVGEDTQLRIAGAIGLQDQRIALQALGDANLGILQGFFPNEMRGSGRAELTAAVNGPLYTPEFSGTATITNGRIRHFSMPNSLDAINGVVRFDSRGVRLDDVTAMMGGGRIQFGGRIGFEGYLPGEMNVTARGESLQLRVPEGVRSVVDADLSVRGNFKAPTIGGTVTVRSALWNRRIDPTAELLDFRSAVSATDGEPGAAAAVPLRFDLQLNVPATLRIENNLARLVVSADMQLRGTAERPLLFGRAEVDRGEILFEGRRYLVTRGALEFNNPAQIEPFFDVEAETRVRVPGQTYRVIINFTGTTQSLVPQFSSDPPLASDADVVALLFSEVRREPGDAEMRARLNPNERQTDILTTRATQLLASPLSSEVGRVVEQTFGVDTFQVTPSLFDPYSQTTATPRINPSARVTIGKRVSDRVYLTFSRSLSTSINDQILLLEYDESDRLSWILSRNENETYSLEVRVRHTF
jgi:autotransporter translocation and assembly factor TamB